MLIYNLFPRLAGTIDRWAEHFDRIAGMGFDWVYLNPVFYPGFSGSIYAVKDFDRLDPVLVPAGAASDGLVELAPVLARGRDVGLRPMIDLVINHTARDSDLVRAHPEWYCRDEDGAVRSPSAIDPADARKVTVWGDLAELDYEGTADQDGLWGHVWHVVESCLAVGFEGFRCDAAYKVPRELWRWLIDRTRERKPEARFVAETLGCRPAEMMALEGAGFDLVMNSSKYWAFDAPWCLDQHEEWQVVAPSVSFPESHDTPRLASETGGLEVVQRQRFALAAFFSAGVMITQGFEHGYVRRIDVVRTRSDAVEPPLFDLERFIAGTLALKRSSEALSSEGHLRALTPLDRPTLVLEKRAGADRVALLVNKDWHQRQRIDWSAPPDGWPGDGSRLVRPCIDDFEGTEVGRTAQVELGPAEIAVIRPE
jgi:starch synthase (maltosyl-transferring)